jgi:hypothetical protein
MNELLAQAYGTEDNIAANGGIEKTAEAALLEELEKVAAAEGIDLNDFDDNDIVEILTEAMGGTEEQEKTASAEAVDFTEDEQVKLAEADFLGRTMAHAFYDELTSIQNVDGVEKTAAPEDVDPEFYEAFESEALVRAHEILDAVGLGDGTVKQSSAVVDDESLDTALIERAGEMLSEAGYDVDAIANALS